jgi:hypothetical protein
MIVASFGNSGCDDLTLYLPRGCAEFVVETVAKTPIRLARVVGKSAPRETTLPVVCPRRRLRRWPHFVLALLLILYLNQNFNNPPTAMDPPMGAGSDKLGTSVDFVRNPTEANPLARHSGKLTFILHVAGDFEDSGFT